MKPEKRRTWRILTAGMVAIAACLLVIFQTWRKPVDPPSGTGASLIMLAVLPFDNLGGKADEYFADGVTEEITARLASVAGLGLIAQTSIKQYKNTDKSIGQIGEELGVEYILEGTVRWQRAGSSGERVRITPQLIRVADATHLWTDVYDEAATEIFDLQTDIATRVVGALNLTLLEPEKKSLAAAPTLNLKAYDYYLKGKEYYDRYKSINDLRMAAEMFTRALDRDSTFAAAHAWLTRIYCLIPDLTDQVRADSLRDIAHQHALAAVRFSSDGVDGHFAMGFYYQSIRDNDRTLEEFEEALDRRPNSSEIIDAVAGTLRRQGRWQEAVAKYELNARLDPRSVGATWELALTYFYLRRFPESIETIERGLSLSPDWWPYKTLRAYVVMAETQSCDTALALIERSGSGIDSQLIESFKLDLLYLNRNYEACVALPTTADNVWHRDSAQYYLLRGQVYKQLGDFASAKNHYTSARAILRARLSRGSTYARDFTALGLVNALLGDTAEALAIGKEGHRLLPLTVDAVEGTAILQDIAGIYALTGEYDAAIQILDTLLTVPSALNIINVKQDAIWDPLRNHPDYDRLLVAHP